jgi:predicted esterase
MSKSFYGYAIFFLIVTVVCGIIHNYVSWKLSEQLLELPSIVPWYITFSIAAALSWIFLSVYLYHKGYKFPFYASLVFLVVDTMSVIAFYGLIRTHNITPFFAVVTFLLIIFQLILSVSIVYSGASRYVWLKRSGVLLFIVSFGTLALSIAALASFEIRLSSMMEMLDRVINVVSLLVPVFIAVNFGLEYRQAPKANERQEFVGLALSVVGLLLIIAGAFNGSSIVRETNYKLSHLDEVPEFIERAARDFIPKLYDNKHGDTLRYRIMFPNDYDSGRSYPIIVCLHGSTGAGRDNAKQIVTCLPAQILSTMEMREKYPAFLFVPQAPRGTSFGGFTNLPGVDSLIIEAILDLETTLPVDTTRRYVTGYSMGGFGAWNMISKWPELFAASVPMCGKGDIEFAEKIKDKPIWAFHGAQDINVPVSGSRDMIEAMKRVGGSPRYTEFPGRAHDITKEVREMPEWIEWMFTKKLK